MRLVFLSHVSNSSGGAQQCLLNLLKGIKQKHPDWQIYIVFPNQGELIDACSPYMEGYMLLRMKWWVAEGDNVLTLRKKLIYIRKLLKYSMKLASFLRRVKPDYGITNTMMLPYLAFACKMAGVKHCWFIHEIPDLTWSNFTPVFKYRFLFKIVDYLSAKILVTSECTRLHYQEMMAKGKISVITQAVELPLESGADIHTDSHTRYSILLVGAFDSNKGQMELAGCKADY